MTEIWKEIDIAPGYEISNLGNVRCWRPIQPGSQAPSEPRAVKKKINRGGYPFVQLGYKGPTPMVHRLVAEAFVPGREVGLEVAHNNGNRQDNRAENLRWTTRKDNHADRKKHGTWGRKLTSEEVKEIRTIYGAGGITQSDLGRQFGVTQATVSKIVRGDTWAEQID